MKRSRKIESIFQVASLFENINYITVYGDSSGTELGRIYNENYGTRRKPSYIAVIISSGAKMKFDNIGMAKAYIHSGKKSCTYGQEIKQTEQTPAYFQLWMKNDLQRKLLGTYATEAQAKEEKSFESCGKSHLEFEIVPVYTDKNQVAIFE